MERDPFEELDALEARRRRRQWWIAIAVVVALGVLWFNNEDTERRRREFREATDRIADLTPRRVEYCWYGTARGVDLTYSTLDGGTAQQTSKANNQCIDVGTARSGAVLYLSVQNTGRSGTLRCAIRINGEPVRVVESEGAFVIATCSGRL